MDLKQVFVLHDERHTNNEQNEKHNAKMQRDTYYSSMTSVD